MASDTGREFTTVFGRGLVGELRNFVHRPYLVVTMSDLWPRLEHFFDGNLAAVHDVTTIEVPDLERQSEGLPTFGSVIGLGGGRALDVAKFFAWRHNRPLFQVPTALTTNAAFAHRTALRQDGREVGLGWAVPEAVYVDFDLVRSAPPLLNRSGVADVLCYHTAHADWKLAHDAVEFVRSHFDSVEKSLQALCGGRGLILLPTADGVLQRQE